MAIDIAKNLFRNLAVEGVVLSPSAAPHADRSPTCAPPRRRSRATTPTPRSTTCRSTATRRAAPSTRSRARCAPAADQFLEDPLGIPLIPNWNRVDSALPDFLDRWREAIDGEQARGRGGARRRGARRARPARGGLVSACPAPPLDAGIGAPAARDRRRRPRRRHPVVQQRGRRSRTSPRARTAGLARHFPRPARRARQRRRRLRWTARRDAVAGAPVPAARCSPPAAWPTPAKLVTRYSGPSGKGSAFRTIFHVATRLGARACAVVDADLRSVTPDWFARLLAPVLDDGVDFVAPLYTAAQVRRHDHELDRLPGDARAVRRARAPADRRRLRVLDRARAALAGAGRVGDRRRALRGRRVDDDDRGRGRLQDGAGVPRGEDPRPEGPGPAPRGACSSRSSARCSASWRRTRRCGTTRRSTARRASTGFPTRSNSSRWRSTSTA